MKVVNTDTGQSRQAGSVRTTNLRRCSEQRLQSAPKERGATVHGAEQLGSTRRKDEPLHATLHSWPSALNLLDLEAFSAL